MPANAIRLHTDADRMLPRFLIRGVFLMIAAALAMVTWARVTDRPPQSMPPVSPLRAEAAIELVSDGMTGAVDVRDASGAEIVALSPEAGGFVAGVHRVILRERTLRRLPADGPVYLRAYENGRLAIFDPSSGWGADLMGFGGGNADAFARLLALTEKGN